MQLSETRAYIYCESYPVCYICLPLQTLAPDSLGSIIRRFLCWPQFIEFPDLIFLLLSCVRPVDWLRILPSITLQTTHTSGIDEGGGDGGSRGKVRGGTTVKDRTAVRGTRDWEY